MSKDTLERLSGKFGRSVREGSMLSNESYISDLLRIIRAQTILEIGTLRGCSAAVFSNYASNIVTIDTASSPESDRILAGEVWSYLKIRNVVRSFLAHDDIHKLDIIRSQSFDMAFIDGGHSYEDVQFDFCCVKACGIVLFHDYKPEEPTYCDCHNRRYPEIVGFVDRLLPPIFIWGPHCSQFALWVSEGHPLRNDPAFQRWLGV